MKGRKVVNARSERREVRRWIYGINAIARRLAVHPDTVHELRLVRGESSRRTALAERAAAVGVPIRDVEADTLRQVTGTTTHQGTAALVDPFRYAVLEEVLVRPPGPLLVLDQVQDPHNFGALVRTAAAVGMAAVIIPRHGAAGVSGAVEKAAAGAVNDVLICRVANICRCLRDLRGHGYWSIALTPNRAESLFTMDMPEPPVLVIGGETGVRALVEETCDFRASVPMRGCVESLNASVAGAIAMYEIARRRRLLDRV